MKLFADDVTIYKEIVCSADVDLLQCDLIKVVAWAKTWLLRLNPDKCESIVLSNKRANRPTGLFGVAMSPRSASHRPRHNWRALRDVSPTQG